MNPLDRQIKRWERCERVFAQNRYDGRPEQPFKASIGSSSNILLTAPHAVNHYGGETENDLRVADLYTGGLAVALAAATGCAFAVNRGRHSSINPRHGATPIDRAIESHQKSVASSVDLFVFDLHGCKNQNSFDAAIGSCGEPTALQAVAIQTALDIAVSIGLRIANNPAGYAGLGDYTMVRRHKYLPRVGIIQIELCRRMRMPNEELARQTFEWLSRTVRSLERIR